MGKHESPPFRMVIEHGRLVPAAAWDQERLLTYRNGSTVSVRLTQEKNRKLERKYWAILGEVIKSCPVKQRTAEDLHKALRLKLGVVDAFFSMEGKLRVEIKSTSGMEEPEYREYFEDAMRELHKATGVDPLTLHQESPDVGEDEPDQEPSPDSSPDDAGSGEIVPSVPAAEPIPSQERGEEAGGHEAGHIDASAPASEQRDEAAWLKGFARSIVAAIEVDDKFILATSKGSFVEGLSKDTSDRARAITKYAVQVCRHEMERADEAEGR